MALTRKFLSALGVEADKIDEIISAHTETVDALKNELAAAKTDAAKMSDVQKELDDLKADLTTKYVTKEEHDKTVTEYSDYKKGIAAKEAQAAKEKAVRAYYEAKGIKGGNLTIAMRGSMKEIEAVELNDKGEIKDTKTLDALVGENGEFAALVGETGARVSTGGDLSGSGKPQQQSRAAQLYQQHYESLYGAQKGSETK